MIGIVRGYYVSIHSFIRHKVNALSPFGKQLMHPAAMHHLLFIITTIQSDRKRCLSTKSIAMQFPFKYSPVSVRMSISFYPFTTHHLSLSPWAPLHHVIAQRCQQKDKQGGFNSAIISLETLLCSYVFSSYLATNPPNTQPTYGRGTGTNAKI